VIDSSGMASLATRVAPYARGMLRGLITYSWAVFIVVKFGSLCWGNGAGIASPQQWILLLSIGGSEHKRVPKAHRPVFDSVVILVARTIWLQRNDSPQ
jgi:hypothetical protein